MNAEEILYAAVSAWSDALVLIGNPPRIYPGIAPQEAVLPLIVFQRTGTDGVTTISGAPVIGGDAVSMTVACWASDLEAATALANTVRDALQAVDCLENDRREGYDEETEAHAMVCDFTIWE